MSVVTELDEGQPVRGLGALHDRLHGKLWHTTRPELFRAIMRSGALLPEPEIDNAERWKTARGPDFYPFVRKLGGVSLFDFFDFDAARYDQTHRLSTWRTFVPHTEASGGAVWIEIDRTRIADQFLSADDIVQQWDEGGHHRHTIMPRIEAAHIGPLPRVAFSSAFLTWGSGQRVSEIDLLPFDEQSFEAQLSEWRSSLG